MKFFWFKLGNNYGDLLTPFICHKLKIPCQWARRQDAEGIMVGSLANQARPGMCVYGSGFIRRNDLVCPSAKYIWVRGPISRKMIIDNHGSAPELYGDAALILPQIIKPAKKIHDVGYVPHYIDYPDCPGKKIFLGSGRLDGITRAITECRSVISSSLHGIIVAHAYGIPAAWIKLSDKLTGDDMKFHDHYESVGLKAQLSTLENPIFQVPTKIETDHMRRLLCSR